MLYIATAVTAGRGKYVVTATGARTEVGKIGAACALAPLVIVELVKLRRRATTATGSTCGTPGGPREVSHRLRPTMAGHRREDRHGQQR